MSEQENPNQQGAASEAQPNQERESVTIDVTQSNRDQEPPAAPPTSGAVSSFGRLKAGLLKRPIQYDIVSIVFSLLILGGGLFAYITKDSTPSLVAGVVCFILLAFGTYFEGSRKNPYPLLVVLVFLGVMFAYRYSVAWKFMPSGLFALLTAIMVARNCYLIYLKRQQPASSDS